MATFFLLMVAAARFGPMLRTTSFIRCCWATTQSTVARMADFLALALAVRESEVWAERLRR